MVKIGWIFQPVPDFFLAIETANEPSPSVNPVMNQGFKLKLSSYLFPRSTSVLLAGLKEWSGVAKRQDKLG